MSDFTLLHLNGQNYFEFLPFLVQKVMVYVGIPLENSLWNPDCLSDSLVGSTSWKEKIAL